jgi:hypothetical protein
VAIRKAIELGFSYRAIARLSVSTTEKYRDAWKTLLELGEELKNVDPDLKDYTEHNIELQTALTYKYMAMHNCVKSEMGRAITFMELALKKIQEVNKASKCDIIKKVIKYELEVIEVTLAS